MMIKNNIPRVTEAKGLTSTELHRKTKSLSWPTVQGLASQGKAPEYLPGRTTVTTLAELALALGCDVSELFTVEV